MKTKVQVSLLFAFVLLLCVSGAVFAQNGLATLPFPEESGMAPVNDIEVYYAVYGEGDPLILLHGGLGNADYWANQIYGFSDDYQVIVMDSRGHGRSTSSDQQIGYSLMASDVLALMDYLEIESASIVGWSDGGIIGLDIAINNPDRLDKLVAYGANYNVSGVRTDVEENEGFGEYVELAVEDYLALSPDPEGIDAFFENIGTMWATEPDFTEAQLGGITSPVLILDGWEEEAIVTGHTIEMAGLIPTAELTLIPDTGHFAMWQEPDRFNSIILSYLATAE